jgi:hypothetical protein
MGPIDLDRFLRSLISDGLNSSSFRNDAYIKQTLANGKYKTWYSYTVWLMLL